MAAPKTNQDTEQRILDAAHSVFVRRGTAGARMQEIAQEAGVNQALLHYYFRTKDALAEQVFQRVAAQLFLPVIQVLTSDASIEEKVHRVIAIELEQLSRAPYLPAYLIGEINRHPERVHQLVSAASATDVRALMPRLTSVLAEQLAARAAEGTMRAIPVEQFVINLLSACIFPFAARPMVMAVLQLDDDGFQRFIAERARELPAFFLNALRP